MTKGQKNLLDKITEMFPNIVDGRMYQAQNAFTGEVMKLTPDEARAYAYSVEGYRKYNSIKQPCKTNKEMKELNKAITQYDKGKYLLLSLNATAYRKLID